jgi:hypothetical protein
MIMLKGSRKSIDCLPIPSECYSSYCSGLANLVSNIEVSRKSKLALIGKFGKFTCH